MRLALLARFIIRLVRLPAELVMELVFPGSSTLHFDSEIDARRSLEAEAEGNFGEVYLVDIEDVTLAMGSVGL